MLQYIGCYLVCIIKKNVKLQRYKSGCKTGNNFIISNFELVLNGAYNLVV